MMEMVLSSWVSEEWGATIYVIALCLEMWCTHVGIDSYI